MGARWYDPSAGDFTSADSVQVNPVPDPAAGNPFAYAADNPLEGMDPSGHRVVNLPGDYGDTPQQSAHIISTSQTVAVRQGTAQRQQAQAKALTAAAAKSKSPAAIKAAKAAQAKAAAAAELLKAAKGAQAKAVKDLAAGQKAYAQREAAAAKIATPAAVQATSLKSQKKSCRNSKIKQMQGWYPLAAGMSCLAWRLIIERPTRFLLAPILRYSSMRQVKGRDI